MRLTNRNHSNPCFWTALWNPDYLDNVVSSAAPPSHAREQMVYSLNVRADKIIKTTVEQVHVDKGVGIAEMTPDAMKRFCKRHFPDKYESFANEMEGNPEILLMPLEQILDEWEKRPAYNTILSVAAKEDINHRDEIGDLAAFVTFQHFRSHGVLRSTLERIRVKSIEPFEYFWLLKQIMGNANALYKFIEPLATSHWLLYRTTEHSFPLPDTPVLIKPYSVMVALSPRLLAEIRLDRPAPEGSWTVKRSIPKAKLREYRHRAIASTFKELIFNDRNVLEEWQTTEAFRRQVKLVREERSYCSLLERSLQQSLSPEPAGVGTSWRLD